jgi:hypothetical protein
MRRALVLALVAFFPQHAGADDRVVIGSDGKPVQLTTTFGGKAGAKVSVGAGKPTSLFSGSAVGTLVAGHDKVLVALATDSKEPFRIALVGSDKKPTAIARPNNRKDMPFAVAGTATPTGFAIFFQEVQTDDPSAAHTYLVELDADGAPSGPATEIPVPWSLAAAAHNGKGYHLALIYPGDNGGMRLSMVSLSEANQPEQHPDWASAAGFISDVHLVADGDKIRAFYRGGKAGERLFESDVTKIGPWGTEPAKAKDHGVISQKQAVAVGANGKPSKVELRK